MTSWNTIILCESLFNVSDAAPPFKVDFTIGFNRSWTYEFSQPSSPIYDSFKAAVRTEVRTYIIKIDLLLLELIVYGLTMVKGFTTRGSLDMQNSL